MSKWREHTQLAEQHAAKAFNVGTTTKPSFIVEKCASDESGCAVRSRRHPASKIPSRSGVIISSSRGVENV